MEQTPQQTENIKQQIPQMDPYQELAKEEKLLKKEKNISHVWMAAFLAMTVIAAGIYFIRQKVMEQAPVPTKPTPTTVYLSPTPVRDPNPIATSSAFILLQTRLSELSKSINQYKIVDSSILPPPLDLDLGF